MYAALKARQKMARDGVSGTIFQLLIKKLTPNARLK
jgi:hypothetical protein